MCAACEALEGQIREIYEGPNRTTTDEQAGELAEPVEACLNAMLPVVEAMHAQTSAGTHARVRWMAAHNSDGGFSWDGDGFAGRLLQATLRDAAVLELGGQ